jgi:hypothetical protein
LFRNHVKDAGRIKDDYHANETRIRKLDVKRWRRKALDREEWASIIREAKAKLKGP